MDTSTSQRVFIKLYFIKVFELKSHIQNGARDRGRQETEVPCYSHQKPYIHQIISTTRFSAVDETLLNRHE